MDTSEQDLRERVTTAYAPAVALFQLFENRLREDPGDRPAVGWRPQIAAFLHLREAAVVGDAAALARLLVEPSALERPAPGEEPVVRAAEPDAALPALVDGRTLILAPTAQDARHALDVLDLPRMALVEPDTRPEPEHAPETWVCGTVVRAYGRDYTARVQRAQRDLLWLEQWPRDLAALAAAEADHRRHLAALAEQVQAATGLVARGRDEAATADISAVGARQADEKAALELRRAEGAQTALREEHAGFRTQADASGEAAARAGQAAEEARARLAAHAERHAATAAELAAAQDREAFLREEVPKAKAALPGAQDEERRAEAALAAAEAAGHASYYRLAAAESALAAEKKSMTLSQRLHLTTAGPAARDLRHEVAERRGEADQAAKVARRSREAMESAAGYRARVAEVIATGEHELVAVRDAQQRLGAEVARLAEARGPLQAAAQDSSAAAARAAETATEHETMARMAEQRLRQGTQRTTAARSERARAVARTDRAEEARTTTRLALEAAEQGLAAATAAQADATGSTPAELAAARETEATSRRHVTELAGADEPAEARLSELREAAVAEIEQVTGLLDGAGDPGETLAAASVVALTAATLAACPPVAEAEFDTLVAVAAGRLTDGEFLLAAARARRWVLLGSPGQSAPAADPRYTAHLRALAELAALPEPPESEPEPEPARPAPAQPPRHAPSDITADDLRPPTDATLTDLPTLPPSQAPPPPGAPVQGPPPPPADATVETPVLPAENGDSTRADVPLPAAPPLSPEARRLLDTGLWERRYREPYGKMLHRLERLDDREPPELLVEALTPGVPFHRLVRDAPWLVRDAEQAAQS